MFLLLCTNRQLPPRCCSHTDVDDGLAWPSFIKCIRWQIVQKLWQHSRRFVKVPAPQSYFSRKFCLQGSFFYQQFFDVVRLHANPILYPMFGLAVRNHIPLLWDLQYITDARFPSHTRSFMNSASLPECVCATNGELVMQMPPLFLSE